jgi:hypothetical protein
MLATATTTNRGAESTRRGVTNPRIAAGDSVVYAELDDGAVLLNVETGIYFGLDAVGAQIWQLLAAGSDADQICQQLESEYDAEPTQLRSDLSAFMVTLASKGLVHSVND